MENQENKSSLECKTIELGSWDKTIRGRKCVESIKPVNPLGMVYFLFLIWFALGCIFHIHEFIFIMGFGVAFVTYYAKLINEIWHLLGMVHTSRALLPFLLHRLSLDRNFCSQFHFQRLSSPQAFCET
jgi:hypothetical protein